MRWPMRPITRRTFALSLLIAPMTCLGCGGEGVTLNPAIGEKRSQKMEEFKAKAVLARQSGRKRRRR
jgi:hypothetical protein